MNWRNKCGYLAIQAAYLVVWALLLWAALSWLDRFYAAMPQ